MTLFLRNYRYFCCKSIISIYKSYHSLLTLSIGILFCCCFKAGSQIHTDSFTRTFTKLFFRPVKFLRALMRKQRNGIGFPFLHKEKWSFKNCCQCWHFEIHFWDNRFSSLGRFSVSYQKKNLKHCAYRNYLSSRFY